MAEIRTYTRTVGTPCTPRLVPLTNGRYQVRWETSAGVAIASEVFASADAARAHANWLASHLPQPQPTPTPTPTPSPTPSPKPIASQGISCGYTILTRPAADRDLELDRIKEVFNGKPGFVRVDSSSGNQGQLDPVVNGILARGMQPLLVLYSTTNPRGVDSFGHDQAAKWLGKVSLFEVANEPDLHGWTPDAYADFVKGVSASIKSANPNATVIAGALWKGNEQPGGDTQAFVKSLATRAKGSFDYLSLHLYDDPRARGTWNIWDRAFPVLFGQNSAHKGNTCREILDVNGLSSVPIISTETGGTLTRYSQTTMNAIIGNDFDARDSGLLPTFAVYCMMDDATTGFGLLDPNRNKRPTFGIYQSRVR